MATHGSLFSGIGGFDLAAQNAGFENVWNCENDEFCQKVLRKNFPNTYQYSNILDLQNPPYVDIISGGFPCQDISDAKTYTTDEANAIDGINGSRSGLWFEMCRIIGEVRPKFVIIENVSALTKKGLDQVLQSLAEIGYDSEWTIITAARFGAPHLRKRIWIVAYPNSIGRQESLILGKVFEQKVRQSSQWELSRTICKETRKKTLPGTYGIHDGIPRRVDDARRMKAIGNSIVPQIATAIFEVIKGNYF